MVEMIRGIDRPTRGDYAQEATGKMEFCNLIRSRTAPLHYEEQRTAIKGVCLSVDHSSLLSSALSPPAAPAFVSFLIGHKLQLRILGDCLHIFTCVGLILHQPCSTHG